MSSSHSDLKEQVAAYVLGSLDRDERAAFEAHLAGCDECASRSARPSASCRRVSRTVCPNERRGPNCANGSSNPMGSASVRTVSRPRMSQDDAVAPARGHNRGGDRCRWLRSQAAGSVYATSRDGSNRRLLQASAAESAVADARRVSGELQSAMGVLAAPRSGANRPRGTGGSAAGQRACTMESRSWHGVHGLESSGLCRPDGCIRCGL